MQAVQVDGRHLQLQGAKHAICQLVVTTEPGSQPIAPGGYAAIRMQLERRLAPVEPGRDMVPGQVQECRPLQRRVAAAAKSFFQARCHLRRREIRVRRGHHKRRAG